MCAMHRHMTSILAFCQILPLTCFKITCPVNMISPYAVIKGGVRQSKPRLNLTKTRHFQFRVNAANFAHTDRNTVVVWTVAFS